MNSVVLMADPRVTSIPVADCGEPLVDVRSSAALRVDHRLADEDGDWLMLRQDVLVRLEVAAQRLPSGTRFLFVEGYRPPALQRRYFEDYSAELASARPQLPAPEVRQLASRFVSPPEIAPHSAGAAVDLTLCSDDGVELDLGTAINANPEVSDGACYTASPAISPLARRNRSLMSSALLAAGLVNYPTEWWHWSYGDRYWALTTGRPAALYGSLTR